MPADFFCYSLKERRSKAWSFLEMSKMIHASLWGVNLVPGDRFLPRCVWGAVLLIALSAFSSYARAEGLYC